MGKDKKPTKFINVFMYILVFGSLSYILSVVFAMLIDAKTFSMDLIPEFLWASKTQTIFFIIGGLALVFGLLNFVVGGDKSKPKMKGKDELENQHFMTDAELEKAFKGIDFNELKNISSRGIPFYAKFHKGHLKVRLTPDCHCLIIGATGTGKTVSFVEPAV